MCHRSQLKYRVRLKLDAIRSSIELTKFTASNFSCDDISIASLLMRFNVQFLPLNLISKRLHFLINRFLIVLLPASLSSSRDIIMIFDIISDILGNLRQTIASTTVSNFTLPKEKNCRHDGRSCLHVNFFSARIFPPQIKFLT